MSEGAGIAATVLGFVALVCAAILIDVNIDYNHHQAMADKGCTQVMALGHDTPIWQCGCPCDSLTVEAK